MDFIKSELKNIIVFVAILVGLYLVYTFFFKGGDEAATTTLSPEGGGGAVGANILPILRELQTIKLDQSVFKDPVFQSLQNFSVELPREDTGRPNPFAPVGSFQSGGGSINIQATPR